MHTVMSILQFVTSTYTIRKAPVLRGLCDLQLLRTAGRGRSEADGGSEAVDSLDRPVRVADQVGVRARSRTRNEIPVLAEGETWRPER